MKNVLIVGGNFANKGAQAMLFVTTAEIKKRFPKCNVYFGCNSELYNENAYTFKRLYFTKGVQELLLRKDGWDFASISLILKNIAKELMHKSKDLSSYRNVEEILKNMDMMVDISGYALADAFSLYGQEYYLNNIRIAKKYDIPIVMMPQSFGPFSYGHDKEQLRKEIAELLEYPMVVYSREKKSSQLLRELITNHNIHIQESVDLVLQHKNADYYKVVTEDYRECIPEITTKQNVAVIPNIRCFPDGVMDRNIKIYSKIIDCCVKSGEMVYIVPHSAFDVDICKKIYDACSSEMVRLLERELDCIEFEKYIMNFDFVICSRYHGTVHAYRNAVPNIVLGWSNKYVELTRNLGQEKYAIDIRSENVDEKDILYKVGYMLENFKTESDIIQEKLEKIQTAECCFSIFDEVHEAIDWYKENL